MPAFILAMAFAHAERMISRNGGSGRPDKKRLADMRRHFSMNHRWDALHGQWMDD
jgi:hypothetical protein